MINLTQSVRWSILTDTWPTPNSRKACCLKLLWWSSGPNHLETPWHLHPWNFSTFNLGVWQAFTAKTPPKKGSTLSHTQKHTYTHFEHLHVSKILWQSLICSRLMTAGEKPVIGTHFLWPRLEEGYVYESATLKLSYPALAVSNQFDAHGKVVEYPAIHVPSLCTCRIASIKYTA